MGTYGSELTSGKNTPIWNHRYALACIYTAPVMALGKDDKLRSGIQGTRVASDG